MSLPDSQVEVVESSPPPRRSPMASSPEVVVTVDEHMEAAEEVYGAGSFDARAHARKAIVDADSFRKLRLFPKAIETLHIALEIDPRSLEIRSRLRDILIESGDREGAIAETVNLAALHLDRGEVAQAEPLLREVVTIEPHHAAATAMLEQVRAGTAYGGQSQDTTNTKTAPGRPALDTYDPSEPLPSYDLEEVGADQALSKDHTTSTTTGPRLMLVDEPFSSEAHPLPSFPLGEVQPVDDGDIDVDLDEEAPPPSRISAEQEALEEALEEADFFAARGLYEDARAILTDQLSKTPNHRLVIERLREVEESLAASGSSQTIERSMLARGNAAAEREDLMDQELPPESVGDVTSSMVHVDVDQVFMKFKAGVRAQVAEADSATHYDLGVAYKEMGLLGEAIAEFEAAARDPHRECMCYAMMGLIYLEQNDLERSAESYIKALAAQSKTVEQEMSLYYDLGIVYEMKGAKKEALYYFQKIARRDPGYRDIADRIDTLSGAEPPKPAQAARAVNDDDDFERAFDDLFEGKAK
jgi:tetratricopeptide (TPR) repeat protein